jgi:phosphatidylglycerophosphatase A
LKLHEQHARWIHRLATWIATGFGIGRAPVAPGTFGTLLGVVLFVALRELSEVWYVVCVAVLFVGGAVVCRLAERQLGALDHPAIVFDEIVGYLCTMWLAPAGWLWLVIGFGLFRLFDIWKPFPIRRIEHLPNGIGVMADDAMAGIYGFVALQALAWLSVYVH